MADHANTFLLVTILSFVTILLIFGMKYFAAARQAQARVTGDTAFRELAEKAAGQYRQGQPVTVYFDPEQPGNAVLEPDNRQGSLAPLIFAAVCAMVGGVFLAFFIKVGFN